VSRRQIPFVVGTLLLLVSLFVGLTKVKEHSDNLAQDAIPRGATEAAAMLAARTEALAFFTFDPTRIEKQIDGVLADASGEFLHDYTARRGQVVANVKAKKQSVAAVVPEGGTAIASFTTRRAVVLIGVDTTTQEGTKSPVVNQRRLLLTMQRSGGRWKTANLDELLGVVGPGDARTGELPGGNVAVLEATANGVKHMLSSDYRTLDEDLASTLPLLTGSFGADFARTFDTSVRLIATRKKSVTDAYVRAVGLVVRDGDKARCLVFVDQVLDPKGEADVTTARLFADLRRVNGKWLVDGLVRA
jgi:hypothetical protein